MPMSLHNEIEFENDISTHSAAHGYRFATAGRLTERDHGEN